MASKKLTPEQLAAAKENAAKLVGNPETKPKPTERSTNSLIKPVTDPKPRAAQPKKEKTPEEQATDEGVARRRKAQQDAGVRQSGVKRGTKSSKQIKREESAAQRKQEPAQATPKPGKKGKKEERAFTFLGFNTPDTRGAAAPQGLEKMTSGWGGSLPDEITYEEFRTRRKANVMANKVRRKGSVNDALVDNEMRGPSVTLGQAKSRRAYLFGNESGATPTDEPSAVSGFVVKDDGTLSMIKALRPNKLQVKSKAKVTREGLNEADRLGQTMTAVEGLQKANRATTETPSATNAADMYTDPKAGKQAETSRREQPEGVQGIDEAAYLLSTIGQGIGYQGGASKKVQVANIAETVKGTRQHLLRSITPDRPRSRTSQTSGRGVQTPLGDQLVGFMGRLSEEKANVTSAAQNYDPSQPPVVSKMRGKSEFESDESYSRATERFTAENEPLKDLSTSVQLQGGGYLESMVGPEQAKDVAEYLNKGGASGSGKSAMTPGPAPVTGTSRPPQIGTDAREALGVLNEQLLTIKDPQARIKEAQRVATNLMGSAPQVGTVKRQPGQSLGQSLESAENPTFQGRKVNPPNVPAPPVSSRGPAKRYSGDISPDERQRMLQAYNKPGGLGPSINSLRAGRKAAGLGSQSVGQDLRTMSIDRRTTSDIASQLMEDYVGRGGGNAANASYFDASKEGWGSVGGRAAKGKWMGPVGEFASDDDTIDQTLKARDLEGLYTENPKLASQFDRTPGAAGAVRTTVLKPGTPEYNEHFGSVSASARRRPEARSVGLKAEKDPDRGY